MRRAVTTTASVLMIAAGIAAATQWVAFEFAYHPALTGALARIGDVTVYAPWEFFAWWVRWGETYPTIFQPAALIVIAGVAAGMAISFTAALRRKRRAVAFAADIWGTLDDAKRAGLLASQGIVLGRLKRQILAHDSDGHVLVTGATRSGKGVGIVVPTLLTWPRSVVVYDIKNELWRAGGEACREPGRGCAFRAVSRASIAHHVGEEANSHHPMVAGVLPETGERFQGLLPPITRAPVFAIRKRPDVIFSLDDYVRDGMLEAQHATLLRRAAAKRENILIAGGTGSGKTTLANAILAEPAFAGDRVILIEDTPELQCAAEDRVEKLTRRTPPAISMRDLVQTTLRMRPDRIIIGEVRDGSALDLLKAWNTGHPGGLATIHANSPRDALFRLEDLIAEVTETVPRRAIASAINLVVFIRRTADGRRVDAVERVTGMEESDYRLEPA